MNGTCPFLILLESDRMFLFDALEQGPQKVLKVSRGKQSFEHSVSAEKRI